MAKFKVPIANAPGKVAILDTEQPGRAVLGKNVYIVLDDGSEVLLDQNDILNGAPVPAPQTVITPQANTTTTTTTAAATPKKAYSMLAKPTQTRQANTTSSGITALLPPNNLSDLANVATARANLGLGSASTLDADTDGTLAANSDSKIATQHAVKAYVDAHAGGGGGKFQLPLCTQSQSTTQDSTNKFVVGSINFDPAQLNLTGITTATLYVLLETSNTGNAAHAELFQQTGTGSPQIIGATGTSSTNTATLVSADVTSQLITGGGVTGVYACRIWLSTFNGNDYATAQAAWLEFS